VSGPARIFLVQGQYLESGFFTTRAAADRHAKWLRTSTGYRHWHAYAYVPAPKAKRKAKP
jgi:hypothetical protein